MKKRAFTFVELLLVMLILGIIMTLTLPIIREIKNDDDIYRSYMKKANQDVTDAMGMIFVRRQNFRGFEMFQAPAGTYDADLVNRMFNGNGKQDCEKLRNAFNVGLDTFECGVCTARRLPNGDRDWSQCVTTTDRNNAIVEANCTGQNLNFVDINNRPVPDNQPGIVLAGKPVMVFQYDFQPVAANHPEPTYGYVYVDMNRDKAPNRYCEDRYRFIIYNDRVEMDTDTNRGGCSFNL